MYIDPSLFYQNLRDFQGRRACIKLSRNTEFLSAGQNRKKKKANYLVDKADKILYVSSVSKFCGHTTLQHVALISAEEFQAEECFLTTAG